MFTAASNRLVALAASLLLAPGLSAQEEIEIPSFQRSGRSARVKVESNWKGECRVGEPDGKKEKLEVAARIEFVDLVDESDGKSAISGRRRYLEWERDWNGKAIDPEVAGAILRLSSSDDSIEALPIEGTVGFGTMLAESYSAQTLGFALEQVAVVSPDNEAEIDIPTLARLMLGQGGRIKACRLTFKLAEADEKVVRMTGTGEVEFEEAQIEQSMKWTFKVDCDYSVDRASGQLLAVTWKGRGEMAGKRGETPIQAEVEMESNATAQIGVDVKAGLEGRGVKLRDVVRRVGLSKLTLELDASWGFSALDELGVGFGTVREVDENKRLSVLFRFEPLGEGKLDLKSRLKLTKDLLAKEGLKMRSCRSALGEGLTTEVAEDDGWFTMDVYFANDQMIHMTLLAMPSNKAAAKKQLAKIRKSLAFVD